MFKKRKWLAVIKNNRWVFANVSYSKTRMTVLKLLHFENHFEEKGSDQDFMPTEELEAQFKNWLNQNHVPLKKAQLAISCPGVITRIVSLPVMSRKNMDKLMTEQVDQYFTLNITDYVVDYRLLERFEEDGHPMQKVLLAAIPKHEVEALWSKCAQVGFKPKVIDLAADSLARVYSHLGKERLRKRNNAEDAKQDVAIIDLNTERVEFVLLEKGIFFLYSDLSVNLEDISTLVEPTLQTQEEIELALNVVFQTLSEFVSFFSARHFGKSIDQIYLTGELAGLPLLTDVFEHVLEIETKVGFPYQWKPTFARRIRAQEKDWMKYGSLYGLALREE